MNRWGAAIFVGLAALGAVSLIGGEDDPGLLLEAADELTQTKDDFESRANELARPDERPVLDAATGGEFTPDDEVVREYMSDEELIDDTRGIDPVPDVDPTIYTESVESEGDVVMYVEDGRPQEIR